MTYKVVIWKTTAPPAIVLDKTIEHLPRVDDYVVVPMQHGEPEKTYKVHKVTYNINEETHHVEVS